MSLPQGFSSFNLDLNPSSLVLPATLQITSCPLYRSRTTRIADFFDLPLELRTAIYRFYARSITRSLVVRCTWRNSKLERANTRATECIEALTSPAGVCLRQQADCRRISSCTPPARAGNVQRQLGSNSTCSTDPREYSVQGFVTGLHH
jgi:hypothetical protein